MLNVFNRLKKREINILSIDGGGIRGLFPVLLLVELEKKLWQRKTNCHLYNCFDMMAGTSTGGLIVLSLATPEEKANGDTGNKSASTKPVATAHELVNFYRKKSAFIFPDSNNGFRTKLKQAFTTKYDGKHFTYLLGDIFGSATLTDVLTGVLVTGYDTERREPIFFKHTPLRKKVNEPNFYIKDVARATSAAPAFFPPARINEIPYNGNTYSIIDGGISANNPALCAYIEGMKLFPNAHRFNILSLGTGVVDRAYPFEEVKHWGYRDWMSVSKGLPLLDMMMDGQRDTVTHMLDHLPRVNHYRFDFCLDTKYIFMDDIRTEAMDFLQQKAEETIHENSRLFKNLSKILVNT